MLAALGPGIVFAGAAIGVSHLVQSTRAGAVYGLSLIGLVLLAHLMKLPAMLFGPRYAAATGRSLVNAYREQGWHAIGAFGVIQVGTMFTIQAAVTIVTAALVKGLVVDPVLGTEAPLWAVSAGVLGICIVPLAIGGYAWLDRAVKVLMVVMALSTLAAAVTQLPALVEAGLPLLPDFRSLDVAWVVFGVALAGWMPAPLDISVWHSLWTNARREQTGHRASRRECEVDFLVGYGLCVVLALSFVVLGAALLHKPGVEPAAGAAPFAVQLVGLYTESLGDWAKPLISVCAIAVMFSTTLTVLDALPRAAAETLTVARGGSEAQGAGKAMYWVLLAVIAGGALLIITAFADRMRVLVDLATTLSFLATPALAWLNHRAMSSDAVPPEHRPELPMKAWSLIGVVFWLGFAGVYVWSVLST